jgi:hypothetical protein
MRRSPGHSERGGTRRSARALAGIVLLALTVVALAGCPFDPRDAPPPRAPGPCDGVLQQNNPEALRRKIVRAFNCGLIQPDYEECLDAAFRYEPDTDALAHAVDGGAPTFFDAWSPAREVEVMLRALQGADQPLRVRMRTFRFRDTGELVGDQARFDVQYEMTLEFAPPRPPLVYAGCARWDLIGVQSFPVRLLTWSDVSSFGSAACMPDSMTNAGIETSGFLRFDRGR